jgi:hypothetical protein
VRLELVGVLLESTEPGDQLFGGEAVDVRQ